MKNWSNNLFFVLVEPKESGNIGASARAIKNMGFRNLCLVNPPPALTDEARWLACNALDVLNAAESYPDVKSAIGDKSIVVGTSRRTGKRRGVILPVEQGAKIIVERALTGSVAILFGREDRGLLNEEVDECGLLMTIPTSREHRSLNLAQDTAKVCSPEPGVRRRRHAARQSRGDQRALCARCRGPENARVYPTGRPRP
jgi:TrmH family RNA methyltransferase